MATKELPAGSQSTTDEKQAQPVKKRSRFKLIMVVGSLLLLLGGGGGAGYWWLYMRPDATGLSGLFGGSSETSAEAPHPSDAPAAEKAKGNKDEGNKSATSVDALGKPILKPVSLPSLTVNLADSSGSRYFKIGLDVELNSEAAVKEIQDQTARIRDSIIVLLSSKTVQELITADGKVLLKNEIAARLNQILGAPRVVRIFFTEFVIQ